MTSDDLDYDFFRDRPRDASDAPCPSLGAIQYTSILWQSEQDALAQLEPCTALSKDLAASPVDVLLRCFNFYHDTTPRRAAATFEGKGLPQIHASPPPTYED